MKYRQTIDYPLPRERVFDCFANTDFIHAKYAGQGASQIMLLDAAQSGDEFRFTFSRDVPVQVDVPAFARSLVPATITLVQTDIWNRATGVGSLDIVFKGMPVSLHCAMTLDDRGEHALQTLDFDIRVSVPLVGGKLEKLLADDLQLKFAHDTEVSLGLMRRD